MSRRTEPYAWFSSCGCSHSCNGRELGLQWRLADRHGWWGSGWHKLLEYFPESLVPLSFYSSCPPDPTENPLLASPASLYLGSISYPFASKKSRTCYSLGHISGSFRPVFCCQVWPQGKRSNYLIIWRIRAELWGLQEECTLQQEAVWAGLSLMTSSDFLI